MYYYIIIIICLEQGSDDLHMVQLMPLPPCLIKIQIGLKFLVPAYPGCPGKGRPLNGCLSSCGLHRNQGKIREMYDS